MMASDTVSESLRLEKVYLREINKARQNLGPGLKDMCMQKTFESRSYKKARCFEYNRGGQKIEILINIDKPILCFRHIGHDWNNEINIKKHAESIALSIENQADQVVIDAMAKMFEIAFDGLSLKQTSVHPTGLRSHMIVTGVGYTKEYCFTKHHLREGLLKLDQPDHDIKNAQLLVTPNIEAQLKSDPTFEQRARPTGTPMEFIGNYDSVPVFTISDNPDTSSDNPDKQFGLPANQPIAGGQRALCFLYIPETIGYASTWEHSGGGYGEHFGSYHFAIRLKAGSVVIDPTGIVGILCNNDIDMGKT